MRASSSSSSSLTSWPLSQYWPLRGRVQAADQVHQRGLAGARRAHDGDVLVALDAQVDAAQGMHLLLRPHVVGLPQVVGAIMQPSGAAETLVAERWRHSAVAIFFSFSGSDTRCSVWPLLLGRSNPAQVRRLCASTQPVNRSATGRLAALFFLLGRRVIHFDARARLQRAQHLVAAGHDFVTLLQALQ